MELRHLRVFILLSEELHFGRTATRLRVAQSAISQTLRDLESELDTSLLERSSRQVRLTEAGVAFLSYAREAVQVVERGARAARAATVKGGQLKIRLLGLTTLKLASLLNRFQKLNPRTVLEVRDGTSARNLEALEGAFCDLAFVSLAAARGLNPRYGHKTLESGPLAVVVPARHRLAKQKEVRLEELAGEKILHLRRDEEPEVRQRLDTRLASINATPTAIELSHPQALLPLIEAGLGVSILPAFVVPESMARLRAVTLAGAVRGGLVAVWNKQRMGDEARRFVALLSEADAA